MRRLTTLDFPAAPTTKVDELAQANMVKLGGVHGEIWRKTPLFCFVLFVCGVAKNI
jgi:hypothetical protein